MCARSVQLEEEKQFKLLEIIQIIEKQARVRTACCSLPSPLFFAASLIESYLACPPPLSFRLLPNR